MASLGDIGRWISEHESLLSGMAAMIALVGVTLSVLGMRMHRLFGRRGPRKPPMKASAATPTTTEPLLAVLAFDNQSSDPEMEFFSDGVCEEIIQRLARGAKLKVIGRPSSFQFRGERKAEAAQSLQCSHVLDGSIRRSGERVRISAHLVEASSRTTL